MSLPRQVQAELDAADAIMQGLQPAADTQVTEPAPEPEPEPEPQPEPHMVEAAPPPEKQKTDDEETWERRYKTLQGMFNAETLRSKTAIGELEAKLDAALRKVADAKVEAPKAKAQSLVTDKDVENYGDDLVDLIKRQSTEVARSELGSKLSLLEEENAQLRERMDKVAQLQGDSARDKYFSNLGQLVPDFETLNVDQGFMGWLAEMDSISGVPRQDHLNHAFNSFDVNRTAALFNSYKELAGVTPPTKQVPRELQRQVSPGTSKASTSTTPIGRNKVWSMAEIEGHYREVTRGTYKGNEAEAARIEAEIDLATQEGRLRP